MSEHTFTRKGFLVWGICAFFFLYEFFLRTVIGSFQHPIMYDLHLTTFQFSLLSTTIFLFIYGMMQIPVGIIVDHIGLKKSLLIAVSICIIASIGFAYSYTYPYAIAFRSLMGFGASFGFICLLISVYDWMPHRHSALFIGLSQFIGTLGPMLAAGPLITLSKTTHVEWRLIFISLSFVGIALFVLIALFVENNQEKAGKYIILYRPEKTLTSLLRLFSRSQPWFIAFFSACVYFTVEYLSENEGSAFLLLKGLTPGFSAYMITTAWLGYAIGCPLLGFLSDFFQRRKRLMVLSALAAFLSVTGIVFISNKLLLMCAFFMLGIGASGQSVGFATMAEQFKKQFVATGLGLNNAMIGVISAVNAPFIGWLIDYSKTDFYPALNDYYFGFSILIIVGALSVIISTLLIRETFCKSQADFTLLQPKKS